MTEDQKKIMLIVGRWALTHPGEVCPIAYVEDKLRLSRVELEDEYDSALIEVAHKERVNQPTPPTEAELAEWKRNHWDLHRIVGETCEGNRFHDAALAAIDAGDRLIAEVRRLRAERSADSERHPTLNEVFRIMPAFQRGKNDNWWAKTCGDAQHRLLELYESKQSQHDLRKAQDAARQGGQ